MAIEIANHKLCPYCAEEVKSAAIFCKHCRRDIGASEMPSNSSGPTASSAAYSEDSTAALDITNEEVDESEIVTTEFLSQDELLRLELSNEIFERWDDAGRPNYQLTGDILTFPEQQNFSDETCQILLGRDGYASWAGGGKKPITINVQHFKHTQFKEAKAKKDVSSRLQGRPMAWKTFGKLVAIVILLTGVGIAAYTISKNVNESANEHSQSSASDISGTDTLAGKSAATDLVQRLTEAADQDWSYDPFSMPGLQDTNPVMGGLNGRYCQVFTFPTEKQANEANDQGLFSYETRNLWIGTDETTGLGEVVIATSGKDDCAQGAADTFGWGALND